MLTRRLSMPLVILLALVGCQDATGPRDQHTIGRAEFNSNGAVPAVSNAGPSPNLSKGESKETIYILQQATTAPPLETYRLSFWAYVGQPSTLTVNYQPATSGSVGDPFLRFEIPRNGLAAGAGGAPLQRGDSVLITLTIDSVNFDLHFDPSGVKFSDNFPANLTIWYANANPDLNGDGVVNGKDKHLRDQLALWYHNRLWYKQSSSNDPALQYLVTPLYHFSQYAVSW